MNIAIYGGTFNPPHKTHINIAKQAKLQFGIDKLIVMPCGIPPHKKCEINKSTRLELCKLAFGSFAEVSDYEIQKKTASYTVETLRHFKQLYPNDNLFLVMGRDSLRNLPNWYCPKEICQLATLIVAGRGTSVGDNIIQQMHDAIGAKILVLKGKISRTNSSEIRLSYQFGLDCSLEVTSEVDEYIRQHGLYKQHSRAISKLQSYLTPQRYLHTFYVVKRGLQFAEDDEKDKAFWACLLHDCAKYVPKEKHAHYGFCQGDLPDPVVHAFLGAKVAKQDFGISDPEILDAIAYHTTARPNMTRLDKIVYVADKTEETRPYPIGRLVAGGLDKSFKKCLLEANGYTKQNHRHSLHPLTDQALKFYFPKLTIK